MLVQNILIPEVKHSKTKMVIFQYIVNISTDCGDVRGCLVDFITKCGKTYGIIKIGSKFEEVDLDKITTIENV